MSTKRFGPLSVSVPAIGQGTWQMEQDERSAAIAALREGLELGLTHIDTAEMYGSGAAEELVAEAIAGRRDEVFLVSKVLPDNASRKGTVQACERSLKRLKTDRLDCYLLHWPGGHPLADTIAAFEELKSAGKIESYGVSNFDETELEEALALAGPGNIACNQVLYHLGERSIEHAVVPFCRKHGVAVVGYTPFGRAKFPPPAGAEVIAKIAKAHECSTRQVALAFLTRDDLFAIPKTSNVEHVRDNAGARKLRLSAADLAAIDAAFPLPPKRRGVPML